MAEVVRIEVAPVWPVKLRDLEHATLLDGAPVLLRARQPARERVELEVHAPDAARAELGLAAARHLTGVDDDLRAFAERFGDDPWLGPSLKRVPWLRPLRRLPWEALMWAVCEQLVTDERRLEIERAITRRHGVVEPVSGRRAAPDAAIVAGLAPAALEACGLAAARSTSLRKCAREVASGRVDLHATDEEARVAGWRRLRAIPGIGPWTVSSLALFGQAVPDALPAGDHALQMLVGGGRRKASEQEVVEHFEPYRPYRGLASWHGLKLGRI